MDIGNIRKEYTLQSLEIKDVLENPITQFEKWMQLAINDDATPEPNIMHLSTCTPEGKPSGRIVLLKGLDHGFIFYTNYESRKSQELLANPFAALTFHWQALEKQVRVEGKIEKVSQELSNTYFESRPEGSQTGAIASPQSQVIPNKAWLINRVNEIKHQKTLIRPDYWGGFRLIPNKIEFWQGQASRLHDRILYSLEKDNTWNIERLAP